jgi:hypothetical protein
MAIVSPDEGSFSGTVRRVQGIGPRRRVEIVLAGDETVIEVDASRMESLAPGLPVGLKPSQYRVFAS